MNIISLVNACKEKRINTYVVIECYYMEHYPALFFSLVLQKMRTLGIPLLISNDNDVHAVALQSMINTSFLGQAYCVWLGNSADYDVIYKKKREQLLENYQGPHTIIHCVQKKEEKIKSKDFKQQTVEQEKKSKRLHIDLDQALTKDDLIIVFDFLWGIKIDLFLHITREQFLQLSVDTIVMLGMYCSIMGSKADEFMAVWYPRLVIPEQSLFELAQYFFARKSAAFFKQWVLVKDTYPLPFWTTYWSEQLWRAYHVVDLRKKEKFNEAKSMGVRLPFSFLNKDWLLYTPNELIKAHDIIYELDIAVKSGSQGCGLDYFYSAFLQKAL